MKNKFESNVGSFAKAKLQAKMRSILAIIALMAMIGFSFAACGGGDDGGDDDKLAAQLNGTWKAGDGTEYTLDNGSFVIAQNSKQSMRGTYTATARSISANLILAVTEVHGDYLAELEEGPTFENKWYNKNQVTDAFRKWMKEEYPLLTDAQITVFLAGQSGEIDALFPTKTAAVDGDTMTLDGTTYTKGGGSTNPSGAPTITTTTLPNGRVGTPYNQALAATGETPITWSITSGALPAGLSIVPTIGVISGTPTTAATSTFTVKATNAKGNDTKQLSITIAAGSGGGSSPRIDMVYVPGGSFQMGSTTGYNDAEIPVHTVTLGSFYISKYEVTQAQWQAVMENNPSYHHGGSGRVPASGETQGNRPVEQVTWYDAVEFCNKLSEMEMLTPAYTITDRVVIAGYIGSATVTANWSNSGYRLPTEAQWEYAAKGGNGSPGDYTYPGSNTAGDVAWYEVNSDFKTHEVGKKQANGLGLYDMGGNVMEWCWDWYGADYYSSSPQNDPKGPATGTARVTRGGGFNMNSAYGVTCASRSSDYPSEYSFSGGFRLVRPGDSQPSGNNPQTATYTGTAGSTAYTLKITENTARYAAQSGDDYELTAGTKKSAGKVNSVSGSVLTLKPSNAAATFTATVSGTSLTALNGTITWTDNTTASAPGTFTGGTTPGTGDGGNGASSLSLSGQVYTQEIDTDVMMSGSGNMWIYEPYTGPNKTFSSNVGGTGTIRNGNLSFSVGTPSDSLLEPFKFEPPSSDAGAFGNIYSDLKYVPNDAKGVELDFDIDLVKMNMTQTMNQNTGAGSTTIEVVSYFYVDRNCTVTATGGTITQGGLTYTYPNLNISYKKGWNTMNLRVTSTTSISGSNVTGTGTLSITAGDSSTCKWVFDED